MKLFLIVISISVSVFSQENSEEYSEFLEFKEYRKDKNKNPETEEEKEKEYREFLKVRKNRKEKSDPSPSISENKPQKWALIFGFGSRALKSLSYTGTSGDLSISAEYLAPKTSLGFLFGVGYQNYKITGSNRTSFAEPLTLDLGLSWHFFPESDLDLYLAGKIGFGTLGDSGAFWKASISPGLRFFLNKTEKDRGEFLFLEGILEKPYFSSQNSPFQEDFYAYGLRIGIGTWL